MFLWENDMPRPRETKNMQKEQVLAIHNAAGALPYRGEWDPVAQQYVIDDPLFIGATNFEVMVMRQHIAAANGDHKAYSDIMDRVAGKPKQALEAISMTVGYAEWLERNAAVSAKDEPEAYIDVYPYEMTEDEILGI
jgi:hypothetical protein